MQHGRVRSAHQVANSVALKNFAHFCGLMLSIHGPEGVNGASSCQHDASTTSRMLIDLPDKKRINRDNLALKAEHKHDASTSSRMLIDLPDEKKIDRDYLAHEAEHKHDASTTFGMLNNLPDQK